MVKDYPGKAQGGFTLSMFLCFTQGRKNETRHSKILLPGLSTEVSTDLFIHVQGINVRFIFSFSFFTCSLYWPFNLMNLSIFTAYLKQFIPVQNLCSMIYMFYSFLVLWKGSCFFLICCSKHHSFHMIYYSENWSFDLEPMQISEIKRFCKITIEPKIQYSHKFVLWGYRTLAAFVF